MVFSPISGAPLPPGASVRRCRPGTDYGGWRVYGPGIGVAAPAHLDFCCGSNQDAAVRWQEQDRKTLARINQLIREIRREPFSGMGKPEPLKHTLSGYWSRQITDEHGIVYKIQDDALLIAQVRYHY